MVAVAQIFLPEDHTGAALETAHRPAPAHVIELAVPDDRGGGRAAVGSHRVMNRVGALPQPLAGHFVEALHTLLRRGLFLGSIGDVNAALRDYGARETLA